MCKVPEVSEDSIFGARVKPRGYFLCKSIALKIIISHLSTNVVEDFLYQ